MHYQDHGEVLPRGTEEEQDLYVFTGSVIKHSGEYYIFYTGHNPHKRRFGLPEQKVLLAKSRDLYRWEKVKGFELSSPAYLEMHDYRDPFVYYDDNTQKFCMLLAGRAKTDGPFNGKGVTLKLHSDDLLHWQLCKEPFYAPGAFYTHECPDLFQMGNWWYLVFSEFSDKVVTTYRMSKSPDGPWITPKNNTFDCYTYYAAKTASDGEHRYLFGWNRIKNHERDDQPGQWGGTIVVHELVQREDGTLGVKCPESVSAFYKKSVDLKIGKAFGKTVKTDNGWWVGSNDSRSIHLFGKFPRQCKVELDFTTTDEVGEFGILLRSDPNADRYYAVKFEPKFNRMAFDMVPRVDAAVHTQIQNERYCPLRPGYQNHMSILIDGSVVQVYINDRVAMSTRMFDHTDGLLGIYTQHTVVAFENIRVYIPLGGQ